MPKTPIDEYGQPLLSKHDVRTAGQSADVAAITDESSETKRPAKRQLRAGVSPADRPHDRRTLRRCKLIGHFSARLA
jgi:hypothetical protein